MKWAEVPVDLSFVGPYIQNENHIRIGEEETSTVLASVDAKQIFESYIVNSSIPSRFPFTRPTPQKLPQIPHQRDHPSPERSLPLPPQPQRSIRPQHPQRL